VRIDVEFQLKKRGRTLQHRNFRIARAALAAWAWFFCHWALAQAPAELQFTSRYDKFQLQRSGGRYLLNDKAVKLGTFDQFLNLFTSEVEGGCPSSLGKADLTVKARLGEKWVERKFHVKSHVVSDGSQCATVSGEGIFYIPLHQSWFDESATASIALQSPLKIVRDKETLAAFEKKGDSWRNILADEYPNWEFFNSYTDSLKDFVITHRVHKDAAEGKPGYVLLSGGKKYEFYKLGSTLWVGLLPGTPWLVGSSRWTTWVDMEKSQWVDRFGSQLKIMVDKNRPIEERKEAMASLEGQWTPSIRDALGQIITEDDNPSDFKMDAVRLMRRKPTLENMGVLIKALKPGGDPELQYLVSQALRTRHPRGPLMPPDMGDGERSKAINEWKQWWQKVQHTKDE
jgi:hypothetical protein